MIALEWGNAAWIGLVSAIAFIVGLIVPAWIVVALPEDYLVDDTAASGAALPLRVVRNLLGLLLLLAGIVMLVTPGQGVLGILSGLLLLEFPGKRALERRIAQRPRILRMINRLRQRAGKAPLQTP